MSKTLTTPAFTVLTLLLAAAGCGLERGAARASNDIQYPIGLRSASTAGLPPCTPRLVGTAALVDSPPALLSCAEHAWKEIPCTNHDFSTASQAGGNTHWACIAERWTLIDEYQARPST